MKFQLLHKGNIIHEMDADDIQEAYLIGRSSSCNLVTPRDDVMISSVHAELFRKNKAVWLRDKGSTNHTFYQNKAINEIKLRPGMELIMGHCVLQVKAREKEKKSKQQFPARLLLRNGSVRGKEVILGNSDLRIGTAEECELCLDDRTISRIHAIVHVRSDESCWIADQGSLNGTRINGDRLAPNKERLLRLGDEIELGGIVMGFIPAGTEPQVFHAGRIALVLIITLLLGVGAYLSYKIFVYPSAEELLKLAKEAAAKQDFSVADQFLSQAELSYDYKRQKNVITRMRIMLLPQWQDTFLQWNKARKSLQAGDYDHAAKILGLISKKPATAWTWSHNSHLLRSQCLSANELIQCYYLLLHHKENTHLDSGILARNLQRSTECLTMLSEPPEYMTALREEVMKQTLEQQTSLDDWNHLWQNVGKLHWDPGGLEKQLAEIEKALEHHEQSWPLSSVLPSFTERRVALREAIVLFRKRYNELLDVLVSVKQKQFLQAEEKASQLLAASDDKGSQVFSVDMRFVEVSKNLQKSAKNAQEIIRKFRTMFETFQASFAKWEYLLYDRNGFADRAVQRELLDASCLQLPYGQRLDSSFHRLLGLDTFYNYAKGYEDVFPADSGISLCQKLITDTETLLYFFSKNNQGETIGWLYNLMQDDLREIEKKVLLQRDLVVRQFLDRFELSSGREKVIACGVALALATNSCPSDLLDRIKSCQNDLSQAISSLDVALTNWDKEFSYANPERQVEIIMEIMKTGLPGHPVVRKIWPKRDAMK